MLFLILAIVVALVAWALRLMEQAVKGQEFSLMIAGFLVATSAAAMMGVYFLMGNYMIYMNQAPHGFHQMGNQFQPYANATLTDRSDSYPTWLMRTD
jgi:hypothetical protein